MENLFFKYARRPYWVVFFLVAALTVCLAVVNLERVLSHAANPVTVNTGQDVNRLGAGSYVNIEYLYMFDTGYTASEAQTGREGILAEAQIRRVYLAELEDEDYLIVLTDRPKQADSFMGAYTGRLIQPKNLKAGPFVDALIADVARAWDLTEQEARRLLHADVVMETVADTGAGRILPMWIAVSALGIVCVLLLAVILNPRMTRACRRLANADHAFAVFGQLDRAVDSGEALIVRPGFVASRQYILMQKWAAPTGDLMWIYGQRRLLYGLRFTLADGTKGVLRYSRQRGEGILAAVRTSLPHVMVGHDMRLAQLRHNDLKCAWELYRAEHQANIIGSES